MSTDESVYLDGCSFCHSRKKKKNFFMKVPFPTGNSSVFLMSVRHFGAFVPPFLHRTAHRFPEKRCSQPTYRTIRAYPRAKLHVDLLTIGKRSGKDAVFDPLVGEYTKRLSRTVSVSERVVKPELALRAVTESQRKGSVMLMDENGVLPKSSVHFSEMIFSAFERGGSNLTMVVGDAEGLPRDILNLQSSPRVQVVSLSPLTFTHKMVCSHISSMLHKSVKVQIHVNVK